MSTFDWCLVATAAWIGIVILVLSSLHQDVEEYDQREEK